jgi:hypothetical protein
MIVASKVAKEELASIRRDIPFNLTLFNIQSPSPDIDVNEAKRWRRLYQYDIVGNHHLEILKSE